MGIKKKKNPGEVVGGHLVYRKGRWEGW